MRKGKIISVIEMRFFAFMANSFNHSRLLYEESVLAKWGISYDFVEMVLLNYL